MTISFKGLITDIQLADALTGWDVAEALRISDPEIPVVYASGNPPNSKRRVSRSAFVSKPFGASELREDSAPRGPTEKDRRPKDFGRPPLFRLHR